MNEILIICLLVGLIIGEYIAYRQFLRISQEIDEKLYLLEQSQTFRSEMDLKKYKQKLSLEGRNGLHGLLIAVDDAAGGLGEETLDDIWDQMKAWSENI